LLVQQNVEGSDFFNRSWEEFKVGFNDTRGNYWLGNELLHQLTYNDRYMLRFDLQVRNLTWYYAEYSTFVVHDEASNYKVIVTGYSGNAGDAFQYFNDVMFSTYDRDNDRYDGNCAMACGGGFWHRLCIHVKVNCMRDRLLRWFYPDYLLQSTRMWLMC